VRVNPECRQYFPKLSLRRLAIIASDKRLQFDEHAQPEDLVKLNLSATPLEGTPRLLDLDPNAETATQHRANLPRLTDLSDFDIGRLKLATRLPVVGQQISRGALGLAQDKHAVWEIQTQIFLAPFMHEVRAERAYLLIERDKVRHGRLELDPTRHRDQSLSARSSPPS
jgi:hypothetical protein